MPKKCVSSKSKLQKFSHLPFIIFIISLPFYWQQSRQTFRKIVLSRAFRKRKTYEALLEKVEMLKSLEVSIFISLFFLSLSLLCQSIIYHVQQFFTFNGPSWTPCNTWLSSFIQINILLCMINIAPIFGYLH